MTADRLHLCQPGYEAILARELAAAGRRAVATAAGHVLSAAAGDAVRAVPADGADGGPGPHADAADLCFASCSLLGPQRVTGEGVKPLAAALADLFVAGLGTERVEEPWPLRFSAAPVRGLAAQTRRVERRWSDLARRRRSRVVQLAQREPLPPGPVTGFFVHLAGFLEAWAASRAVAGGQRRMRDDPAAPSRSYLKLEEALAVMGDAPGPGQTAADLGAAPGGWSYAAARRGARVHAVDNGPLRRGAADHPLVTAVAANAFTWRPPDGAAVDWLLCDLVADPFEVLGLVRRWLERRWFRAGVVNLKFGRTDPLRLLRLVRDAEQGLGGCGRLLVRHLFHDRDEFTVMIRVT